MWSGGSVPIGGGPGIESKTTDSQETKWEGSGDFVFAFRVSKVVVKKTGDINEEEFREGAMLGGGRELKLDDLCILSVEEPNMEAEGFGELKVMEDDEVIVCGIPKLQPQDD
jgi:hypothetical protein